MKKLRILLVVCAMIFAIFGISASFAAMDASATLAGPEAIREGDTSFTLEFKASADEIFGMTAKLTETGPITRQSIKVGSDMANWTIEDVSAAGIFMMYGESALADCENKVLFTVTYTLNETAKVGDAISVTFGDIELTSSTDATDPFSCSYNKTVARKLNTNTNLLSLKVDGTALSGFDPAKTEYRLTLPYTTDSLNITATCAGEGATYKVTGNTGLKFGENNVVVTVTAESGATKAYTVKVTRQDPPDSAYLMDLSAGNSYPLSPEFDPLVTEYTVSVPYTKTSISFTHSTNEGVTATVEGGSKLAVGENTVTITVTDKFEHTRTYTVTVTRRQNSNANLLKLSVDGHTLSPAFVYTTTKYSMSVNSSVASLTVKATAAGDGAQVSINGSAPTALTTSSILKMEGDSMTVVVTVTAMDGTTTKDYTIEVSREGGNVTPPDDDDPPVKPPVNPPSDNSAKLSSLVIKGYDLDPVFEADINQYALTVPNGITSLEITALGANGSEITVTGDTNLKVGQNTVTISVKEAGKDDAQYVITVTRAAAQTSADSAKLQSIVLSKGELSPIFHPDTLTYVVYLPHETTKLTVSAVGGENATVQGAGNYTLVSGVNTITLISKTVDGTATYTLYVYVMPAFSGTLPNIGSGNDSTNSAEKSAFTVTVGTSIGDKLTAQYEGSVKGTKYTYELYHKVDGVLSTTPVKSAKNAQTFAYVLTTADTGKDLVIRVKDASGAVVAEKTVSGPQSTASLGNKKTGFDIIGMVISLIAALATLIIGFILGKMFGRRH
ncbi:MAG: cadherin-like beta sandwich domain-containing protein [Ruminococcaceae bacterium]|nr:cadherin-like beta sandwich domain-containing protein [Oscillospiraceae bacterium]